MSRKAASLHIQYADDDELIITLHHVGTARAQVFASELTSRPGNQIAGIGVYQGEELRGGYVAMIGDYKRPGY